MDAPRTADVPPERGENEFSKRAVRRAPIFPRHKGTEIGHFIIRNFARFLDSQVYICKVSLI